MRDIRILKVYNLVDSKGNKLQLRLGILKSMEAVCAPNADQGYRWSFVGEHIPMPVRSMTWFNGFPENIMLDWLKGNDWYPRTCVSMCDGRCRVYELPSMPSKGNENATNAYNLPEHAVKMGKRAFNDAIKLLHHNQSKVNAVCLYRYVNRCDLLDANRAVDAILLE